MRCTSNNLEPGVCCGLSGDRKCGVVGGVTSRRWADGILFLIRGGGERAHKLLFTRIHPRPGTGITVLFLLLLSFLSSELCR